MKSTLFAIVLALVIVRPASAANKEHQQLMADLRILQEQSQLLQNMVGTLTDAIKAVNTRLDQQLNVPLDKSDFAFFHEPYQEYARELLPNLVGPIIVYSTLLIPSNILFEAALSFLGVGIQPPQASWGGMLNQAISLYQADPWFMLVPGLAIFITVLAFNLLGDGLRDALDPRSK